MAQRKKKTSVRKRLFGGSQSVTVGNYILDVKYEGDFTFLSLSTVSGTWEMRLREDSPLCLSLRMMGMDRTLHPFLEAWITMMYSTCNIMPDLEFFEDFYRDFNACTERYVASQPALPEQEDARVLYEERTYQEMMQDRAQEETTEDA